MIPEIGQFALILALFVALAQGTVPMIGAATGRAPWMTLARTAAHVQCLLILTAFACLTQAYVVSDFSVQNVAQNSHTLKPLLYKVSGVWGNHEGSMVLWVLILALFGLAVAAFGGNLPPTLRARVLAIQGLIGAAFLAFILFTSNPFLRLDPAPLEGSGLNPILQDPGLAFHPPFLYLGYVGFSMAFSFAVAALIEGRVDPAWARWVRPWTLAAWCALTVGIALGSWWAYYELGWGGWWFWDPVENASFIPWLIGTALLHSSIVVEKRDALKSWTVLLAILAFSMSLLGTFLVRSGVLTSVHTFAADPERGVFILGLLVVVIGGSLILYAVRAPALKGGGLFAPISREGALVLNNLLLTTGAAVVLLGTLYPLILDAFGGGKVSVGAPFFNSTFVPLMVPVLLACTVGAMLSWKRADLAGVLSRLRLGFAGAIVIVAATAYAAGTTQILAALGMGLAGWLIIGSATELCERIGLFRLKPGQALRRARGLPRAAYGMAIAHGALGILVIGVTASSAWRTEHIQLMRPGDVIKVADYTLRFEGATAVRGPNYTADQGRFTVMKEGVTVTVLKPEKRIYPAERSNTSEAGIRTTIAGDLYVVLGDRSANGAWATRLYFNPLVAWIWVGAVLMSIGGLVSLTDRRYRVGAPKPAKQRLATASESANA
ncbi:MAG: heme lyase CcmF/NrfE family subunit [Rhodospirillaceae bacterium]|jgi:cytochrome c-type biogenesis protein CcmF|nr:heme lyase CcmF/NrfE family subunit [Rhodospirillaceae bacterium]MBT5459677.1 heme lyase CcmF/NrfE family subunit [Rhodospirillaceae bacterium]